MGKQRIQIRSASELGIEWIGSLCPDGRPHYFIGVHTVGIGSLLKCSNCYKHVWIPFIMKDAAEFDVLVNRFGANTAYQKMLDKYPEQKILVGKLQKLWYMRQEVGKNLPVDKVLEVMGDKDYGRANSNNI